MGASRERKALFGAAFLALMGTLNGAYLTILHLKSVWGNANSDGLCHALSKTGCEIALSESGLLFGVPIAMIGVAGSVAMFFLAGLALLESDRSHSKTLIPAHALWFLALGGVLASIAMAFVSLIDGRVCPFCVIWYGISIALFLASWAAVNGSFLTALSRGVRSVLGWQGLCAMGLFVVILGGLGAKYTLDTQNAEIRKSSLYEKQKEQVLEELGKKTSIEVPEMPGVPSIRSGKGTPHLRIVEFSDLECPFCRRLSDHLETFMEESEVPIVLEFVHFPLNRDCNPYMKSRLHESACDAARASICAHKEDQFWPYIALAFQHQSDLEVEDLVEYATTLGMDEEAFLTCLDSEETQERLLENIESAAALGVRSTPTMLINGYKVSGALTPEILQMVSDALQ
jgi:protein-disulfide isomerase